VTSLNVIKSHRYFRQCGGNSKPDIYKAQGKGLNVRSTAFVFLVFSLQVIGHAQEPGIRPEQTGVARPRPRAVYQQSDEFVIPELIIGGEWTSTIKLANWSSDPIGPTTINFIDDSGKPMNASFRTVSCTAAAGCTTGQMVTDRAFIFYLSPGGMIELTFYGGSATQVGHAEINSCSKNGCSTVGLYAEVILKNSNSTRPDFESVFPLEQPAPYQFMAWDHRNGVTTTLYLVNPNPTKATATLVFYNQVSQTIGTQRIVMDPYGAQIITLHALVPQTIGLQGTLAIAGVDGSGKPLGLVATGLRINPSNSFTPLRANVPAQ
jgi:hypothetical protein